MKKKSKKKYNPFKMWGSWVGVVVINIYYYFSTKYMWFDMRDILLGVGFTLSSVTGGHVTAIFLNIILGFLIGWGIQSLIRKRK